MASEKCFISIVVKNRLLLKCDKRHHRKKKKKSMKILSSLVILHQLLLNFLDIHGQIED